MSEELVGASQKLLISVITLGFFCAVCAAHSMYVLLSKTTEQVEKESRARAFMLSGVTIMSGAIFVLGFDELSNAFGLFEGLNMNVPPALRAVASTYRSVPSAVWWGVVAVVALVTLAPVFVRDAASRTRLNRATAGLNFFIALWLMLLATGLYGAYRVIEAAAAAAGGQ